jgi:hypothetical protein
MAWTPMYLLSEDVAILNDWLNQEDEIAFLVSNGKNKWIATKQHDIMGDIEKQKFGKTNFAEYKLWHVPSGPLPLSWTRGVIKSKQHSEDDVKISNPWAGWTEIMIGANSRVPYFGAGHPGVISLVIKISNDGEIPMSSFGWIGNHYKIIGNAADPTTEMFWNKLKRMVKKIGTHIPRSNSAGGKKEIYAFPVAYKEIQNGRQCSLNPW